MDEFDLGRLTDFDFEKLSKDIFEVVLGEPLEIFAPGRDRGIDLRRISPANGDLTVIQCKHWLKSGPDALIRHMDQVEYLKVVRLNPDRYILATTVELTVGAKDKLAAILGRYLKSPGDLYGAQEIIALLREHPEIVRRHIRLWLASASVLTALLNRDVLQRSRLLARGIDDSLKVYVPSVDYDRALRLLDERHSCLIVGLPGIGKTTLAHVLLAAHRAEGFTMIEASGHLGDVFRMWDDDEKQIFFVDDFLGQTTIDGAAARTANQELPQLLREVSRSSTKRVVLTCRQYVLRQAQEQHDRLATRELDLYEQVINPTDYTRTIRAEIFYNHVYFSDLPAGQRAELADPAAYNEIVDHQNYSPRLLEQAIIEAVNVPDSPEKNVANIILRNLDNPRHLWQRLIEHILDVDELAIILVLYTAQREAAYVQLVVAWRAHLNLPSNSDSVRRFQSALKRLESTMIRVVVKRNERIVEFHSPSVLDFLHEYVSGQPEIVVSLIDTAVYFDQLEALWAFATSPSDLLFRASSHAKGLYEVLSRAADRFRDAVIRLAFTMGTLATRREQDELTKAMLVIKVGKMSYSEGLGDLGMCLLDQLEEEMGHSELFFAAPVGELTLLLNDSTVPSWKARAARFAEFASERAIEEIVNWQDADQAERLLRELTSVVPSLDDDMDDEIRELRIEIAREEMDSWADGRSSEGSYVDRDELEEMVGFLTEQGEDMPGMEEALAFLEAEPPLGPQGASRPTRFRADSDGVDQIFSRFRTE